MQPIQGEEILKGNTTYKKRIKYKMTDFEKEAGSVLNFCIKRVFVGYCYRIKKDMIRLL
ncbi:hypothetical protein [Flavobacterium sp. ENC]|uniref:hypothetical protein n=1 Tax=Flavobacterium sp. ENC TaxID=2897330 RepID=UPI001E5EF70F|nr:hypothetical protein [Flavobacterium sp. ENC]MCD0467748.1 hypothetical protein [Flavobacterium sp. ENC]